MKNKKISVLALALSLSTVVVCFFACQKTKTDNTNTCASLTCQNGGHCQSGACICPSGYSGTNCEINSQAQGTLLFYSEYSTYITFGQITVYLDTLTGSNPRYISGDMSANPSCTQGNGALFYPTLGVHDYKATTSSGQVVWRGSVNVVSGCNTVNIHL